MREGETPGSPATREFGHVSPGGPALTYPETENASVTKFSVGDLDNNVYVIRCKKTGDTLVIDGADDAERIAQVVGDGRVVGIVQTHSHWDHVRALPELVEAWGCPVYAHPDDHYPVETVEVHDGHTIAVGELEAKIIHTPGHTPGSLTILCDTTLFTGDTLFPGGPGATGGDEERFAQVISAVEGLFELPGDTRVSPGHGLDTTIARERPHLETWRARGW